VVGCSPWPLKHTQRQGVNIQRSMCDKPSSQWDDNCYQIRRGWLDGRLLHGPVWSAAVICYRNGLFRIGK
jgi:hypothetical protein